MITPIVLLASVAVLVIGLGITNLTGARSTPLDTERQEQWFVAHAPAPLRRALRFADRRIAGGAALLVVFVIVFGSATGLGWLLDSIDGNRGFARWDQSAAEWGAQHASDKATALEAITQFGASGWLLIVMGLIGVFFGWRRQRWAVLGYLAAVGIGVSLINNGLKLVVHRERPNVHPLTTVGGYSFPSGHTAAAAACWAAIALVLARRQRRSVRAAAAAAATVITIAVAATRVLLGVHWLTDVLAGVLTGWAYFLLVTVLFGGRLLRFGEPVDRIADSTTSTPSPRDERQHQHDLDRLEQSS
jgi:undecaprenyl-diphosphatase